MDKTTAINSTRDGKTRIPLTTLKNGIKIEQYPSSSLIWLKTSISNRDLWDMRLDSESFSDEDYDESDYAKLMLEINSIVKRYYPELNDVQISWNDETDPNRTWEYDGVYLVSDFDFGDEDA